MKKSYLIKYFEGGEIQEVKKVITPTPKTLIKTVLHSSNFTLLKVVEIDPDKHFNLTIYSHELTHGYYSTPKCMQTQEFQKILHSQGK